MPDATITSTASTFGTITGTFASDQSTVTGTITGIVAGTLTGSVGVPGPQGPTGATGATGAGVAVGGTTGQLLQKLSATNYDTGWTTVIPGDRYLTSSTTSNTLSNTTKTFTIGTGLSYTPTQNITISYDASNHMHGEVLTYNSGTGVLTVDINYHTGSGTYAAWVVNVGGVTPATSVAWGAITGTLSTQTDLQSALDLKLELSGGALDANASITASDTSTLTDSELAGWGLGVQLTADHTKGTTVEFDGLDVYDGASHMAVTPTGLTFPDATVQTVGFPGFTGYASESWVTAGFYPLTGNPSAFIDASALTPYLTSSTALAYFSPIGSPSFTGNPIAPTPATGDNSTSIATTAFVKTQGYATLASPSLTGTPFSTTAAVDTNTTQIATTAYVVGQAGSATPLVNGTAAVGTSLRYARQDHVHGTDTTRAPLASPTFTGTVTIPAGASISGFAPLASPTFTGTPTLPTGTIAVTQTAGNNTTAVATTAFVTAAVPAYATAAQGRSAISTTTAMNPSVTAWQHMFPGSVDIVRTSLTYAASGTMGTTGTGFLSSRMTLGTAGACSANFRTFGGSQIDQAYGLWSQNYRSYVNFSKFIWCSGRFYTEDNFTDPNVTVGFYCGKAQNSANGDLARAGFGWKFSGNATAANRKFVVCAHNGTTLTTVTSSFAIVAQQYVDWDVVSNGSGTVTLYINGNEVATTTGGPTADTSYSGTAPVIWNEEMITTTVSAGFNATFGRGRFYMAP